MGWDGPLRMTGLRMDIVRSAQNLGSATLLTGGACANCLPRAHRPRTDPRSTQIDRHARYNTRAQAHTLARARTRRNAHMHTELTHKLAPTDTFSPVALPQKSSPQRPSAVGQKEKTMAPSIWGIFLDPPMRKSLDRCCLWCRH